MIVVVDGLTRCHVLGGDVGGTVTAAGLPGAIVDRIFAKKGSDGGTDGVSGAFRKGRTEQFGELRGNYLAAAGDTTDPNLTRYGQTVRVPANIIVSFRRVGKPLVGEARLYEFPDAVDSRGRPAAQPVQSLGAVGDRSQHRRPGDPAGRRGGNPAGARCRVALGVEDFSFADVTLMDPDGGLPEIDRGLARGSGWLPIDPAGSVRSGQAFPSGRSVVILRSTSGTTPTESALRCAGHGRPGSWRPTATNSARGRRRYPAFPHWHKLDAAVSQNYADLVPIALDTDDPRQGSAVATLQCRRNGFPSPTARSWPPRVYAEGAQALPPQPASGGGRRAGDDVGGPVAAGSRR